MLQITNNLCFTNQEIPFGLPQKSAGSNLKENRRRREIPLVKAQRSLATTTNDGPIDGLFDGDKWVVDTAELLIKEKTNQMYKRHWFARLTNSIMWETKEENGIPRTHMLPEDRFQSNLEKALENIRIFKEACEMIITSRQFRAESLINLTKSAGDFDIEIPTSMQQIHEGDTLKPQQAEWLEQQKEEITLASPLLEEFLHNVLKELQPIAPSTETIDEINKVFEKIQNIEELKQMFKNMKPNKVSGPSGM